MAETLPPLGLFLLFAGFALLCIQYRRSPALYAGVVGALIIAMIVEPLVHTYPGRGLSRSPTRAAGRATAGSRG
ncbi:MAG: hypothetical protein R2867_27990 [Caldilineaceae bacterium]